jgi:hypothetical protein
MTPTAHPEISTAPTSEAKTKKESSQTQDVPFVSVFATMTRSEGIALGYQMEENRMHRECFGV